MTDSKEHMEERRLCYVHASGHKASSEQSQQRQVLQDKLISLSPADQALVKEIWASYDQAPGPLRPLILDGILHRSCLAQLSLLSSVTQSLLKIDYIKSVPFELAVRIFQYLDAKSLCHAAQVSKTWNRISNDDLIWYVKLFRQMPWERTDIAIHRHRMCNQHIDKKCNKCGWGLPLMQSLQLKKKSNKRKFVEEQVAPEETRLDVSESSSTNASNSSIEPSISTRGGQEKSETELVEALPRTPTRSTSFTKRPWKEIYAERLVMERNWRKGVYSVKDFVGHTDAVMCLQFDEHSRRLVTGSFDTTLRVWDTDSDTCIAVLKGHTAVVRAVQFDTSTIISGSIDSTIRIWNAQTFECVRVLTGHNSQGITCLDFQEKLLVSGSVDGSVQIWDLSTASVSLLTGGHRDWVNCVKIVNKHLVASSSDDATLKIWDIASKTPIMTFSGHMG